MKLSSILIALIAVVTVSNTAFAQSPYAPKKLAISEVIKEANYDRVPIRFPNYSVLNTRTVVQKSRLDFEVSYDVDYWELIDWIEGQYKSGGFVSALDPEVFPNAKAPELRVYGKSNARNGGTKFTLGNPDLPYRFDIVIRPDEQSRAVVVIHNGIFSLIYSGDMPARAPFKPAGKAKPIPFRWN